MRNYITKRESKRIAGMTCIHSSKPSTFINKIYPCTCTGGECNVESGRASWHSHLQTQMKVPLYLLTIHKHTTSFLAQDEGPFKVYEANFILLLHFPFFVRQLVPPVPDDLNQSCISRILQKLFNI